MKLVVPDASVILKWVLQAQNELDTRKALSILEDYRDEKLDLRLPTLWRYEVGNVLGIKHPKAAREAMEILLGHEFMEEGLDFDYCAHILQFMTEVGRVSFYDVAYHVLAIRNGGTCVTADEAYVKKAGRKGHIMTLSRWAR